jgi:hypothetical protein
LRCQSDVLLEEFHFWSSGSILITSCTTSSDSKSEPAIAKWFTPLIEEVGGTLDEICETAVCVDGAVVLPAQRVVLATTDIEMPDTLGALTLNRIWIGEGKGLFGEGWTSVWDITLTDETLTGALPADPWSYHGQVVQSH